MLVLPSQKFKNSSSLVLPGMQQNAVEEATPKPTVKKLPPLKEGVTKRQPAEPWYKQAARLVLPKKLERTFGVEKIPERKGGLTFEVGEGLTESKKIRADKIIQRTITKSKQESKYRKGALGFSEQQFKKTVGMAGSLVGTGVAVTGGIYKLLSQEASKLESRVIQSKIAPPKIKQALRARRFGSKIIGEQFLSALNTKQGKRTIDWVGKNSADLPLKGYSLLKGLGANTYADAYKELLKDKKNPGNSYYKKFLYDLQSTVGQTGLGVLLTLVAGRVNPKAGQALGGAYWTALSADEQLKEGEEVQSIEKLAIDVLGDSAIGNQITKVLKQPQGMLRKSMNAFHVEAGTEVSQSFLKFGIDYKNAKTDTERDLVVKNAEEYVTSGAMLTEYLVGGLTGGGIAIITFGGAQIVNINKKELEEDVKQIDKVFEETLQEEDSQEKEDVIAILTKSKNEIQKVIEKKPLPVKKKVVVKPIVKEEVKPISKEQQPLYEEAKKYKSAEELYERMPSNLRDEFRNKGIKGKEQIENWWKENNITTKADTLEGAMQHRPSKSGVASNIPQDSLPDFYERPNLYDYGGKEYSESIDILQKIRNKPNSTITIYRASPKNELRTGDCITLSKEKGRLESLTENVPVQEFKVKVKEIQFAGDDITEFGYWGKPIKDIYNKANKPLGDLTK